MVAINFSLSLRPKIYYNSILGESLFELGLLLLMFNKLEGLFLGIEVFFFFFFFFFFFVFFFFFFFF